MELVFDLLTADEIECRVGTVKQPKGDQPGGVSLLLYKDARCDMTRLDKTVGPMNWQRKHTRENANCTIEIWDTDKGCWVGKEDTGVASRTEAEKGLASDSFKRAGVNWGIGRELYTAPFIWISGNPDTLKWERFSVKQIGYNENRCINALTIVDKRGKVVFQMGKIEEIEPDTPDAEPQKSTVPQKDAPAKVEVTNKLPQQKVSPVGNYIMNEIAFMQEQTGAESYQAMKATFNAWHKQLLESGAVEKVGWDVMTLDQAKELVKAIKVTFLSGDAA